MKQDLIINMQDFPPLCFANACQELMPMPSGEFKKSLNGNLIYFENTQNRKYKSVISASDMNTPLLHNLWIGCVLSVKCIPNIWQIIPAQSSEIEIFRNFDPDSISLIDSDTQCYNYSISGSKILITQPQDRQLYLSYTPIMQMMVTNFETKMSEDFTSNKWTLYLQEV